MEKGVLSIGHKAEVSREPVEGWDRDREQYPAALDRTWMRHSSTAGRSVGGSPWIWRWTKRSGDVNRTRKGSSPTPVLPAPDELPELPVRTQSGHYHGA